MSRALARLLLALILATMAVPAVADDIKEMLAKGDALWRASDFKDAAAVYDAVMEAEPTCAMAFYGRAFCRLSQSDLDAALEDFDKAIRLDPGFGRAYRNRGVTHQRKGNLPLALEDVTAAIRDMDRVIELEPKSAPAHAHLGHMDEATRDAKRAIDLDPLAGITRAASAYKQAAATDFDAAFAESECALAMAPTLTLARFARGCGHCGKRRPNEALADFTACLEAHENVTDDLKIMVLKARSIVFAHLGEKEKAEADTAEAKRLAETTPSDTAGR